MSAPPPTPPSPQSRPRIVDAAFWLWVIAAVLFIVGGLLTATVGLPNFPAVFRAAGGMFALVGAAMAGLAGRLRSGDARSRRAGLALALATTVVVVLLAVLGGVVHLLIVLGVLPLIAGVVCITRPLAQGWFDGSADVADG